MILIFYFSYHREIIIMWTGLLLCNKLLLVRILYSSSNEFWLSTQITRLLKQLFTKGRKQKALMDNNRAIIYQMVRIL